MADTLFIAPDIFGHTPALDRLAGALAACPRPGEAKPCRVEIIDPYDPDPDGSSRFFRQEEAAYDYFKTHSDIQAYSRRISDRLAHEKGRVTLVGFSAGASAVWYLSGRSRLPAVNRAIGFYGSQIRHYINITPCFDIHLIFPIAEPHFSVDRLIKTLCYHPRVSCEKAAGRHGFMNEYSRAYDPDLYRSWFCACTGIIPPVNPAP